MPGKPIQPGDPLDLSPEEIEQLEEVDSIAPTSNVESVTLKGLVQRKSGEIVKSKYFNIVNQSLDDYSDIKFTPEEAKKVKHTMTFLSTGSHATTPVTCTPNCPWKERCVYFEIGKAPFGRQCLVEVNIMKSAQINFLEEYEVDPSNYTEWTMISQLAEIEVMLWRINQNLAKNAEEAAGVVEQNVGFDRERKCQITQTEIPHSLLIGPYSQ